MLDIKFIRDNVETVIQGAKKKRTIVDIPALISLDEERRKLAQEIDTMRAEQNAVSDRVVKASSDERTILIESMKKLKDSLSKNEESMKDIMKKWQTLMLQVPNVPDITVPDGVNDADNREIKTWGDKPVFGFEPKDHGELMSNLGMVDFERGVKVHGFRGYYLVGQGARLSFAIWNYALDFFGRKGFSPVIPPTIVRKNNLYGTGHLPGDVEDFYETQDGNVLAGTSEVPIMAMFADEVLPDLIKPLKYLGFSPCYRREAGSHGKDVKGLIRVNEFYKLEQVILCEASHETSVTLHEELNRNTEEFIESLGIPYRTVVNCGGDLGLGQVKKYDIELWIPKEGKYREISSASYFHDFQCRRFNIRYKYDNKLRYAHSLNCTAIPTPRILVSMVENFQKADGSITIPSVLRPYMGIDAISHAQ